MTFLPIVERELRVAARRRGTYWTRWFAAVGMLAVWLLLAAANRRASSAELSKTLFIALGVLALGFCLLAGIFLTADCLSEEKREGTLGLLFLTDLRGYDVVLGKLIATSVHSVYGLLAMFPVLALPLLMGGVTVGEFWRMVSVLVATLLLSLGMGMFTSAIAREARAAMAGTFLGMLVLAGALPALWWAGDSVLANPPPRTLLWPSPASAFGAALDSSWRASSGSHQFWCSLQTVSGLGLGLLVLAALLLPRGWQEGASRARVQGRTKPEHERPARLARQLAYSRSSLDGNPYLWLAGRARSSDLLAGLLLGLLVLFWFGLLLAAVVSKDAKQPFIVCLFAAYALHQAGKYIVGVDATRQLMEDRRSGALELLLVTPLGEDKILSGQKRALETRSQALKVILVLVNVCMGAVVLTCRHQLSMDATDQAIFLELFGGGIVVMLVDFKALQRVGMWMALRARKHQRAVLGTLGRVMVMPWAGMFLWVFLSTTGAFSPSSDSEVALVFALWFGAGIVNDLVFVAKARASLGQGLRHWVTEVKPAADWEGFLTTGRLPRIAQGA